MGRKKETLCVILETNRSRSYGESWLRWWWWWRAGTGRSVRLNRERRGWVALAGLLLVVVIRKTHHHILIIIRV